jgi:hypothetical protein
MQRHPLFFLTLLTICCIVGLSDVSAQNLTDLEKEEIKRRATFRMQEFEQLLQLIADPTRSRGAIDRFIVSSYSRDDTLFNQVFFDDQVIIEDDLTPIDLTQKNVEVSALPVATYLNNFKLQYQKSYEKTVFFTDLEFSDVRSEGFTYLIVSYKSEFRGGNSAHPDYQYAPVKRKATLRAAYSAALDRWQVHIAGVNYDRSTLTAPAVAANTKTGAVQKEDIPDKKTGEQEVLRKVEEREADAQVIQAEDKEEVTARQEKEGTEEALPSLEFTSAVPDQVKKGRSLPLGWNTSVADATVTLYKGDTRLREIRRGLYGEQWNWTVAQKPGKDFSIRLYEPSTGRSAATSPFRVKSRFPLALKIGMPVAVIGTVFLLTNRTESEVGTIDIEPAVPSN